MNSGWFVTLRAVLELAYFAAGIAIAFFAGFVLQQITLTKRIATANAKRESLKFAAERCQYYAERCVPLYDRLVSESARLGLTFLATSPKFAIFNGEILPQPFDRNALFTQYMQIPADIVATMNALEAFAIPFAAGVADDELGFQETAVNFCQMVEQLSGAFIWMRISGPRYESVMKVYDSWKNRLVAQNLEGKMKQIQAQHKAVAEKGKLKPTDPY
jgi:hypothetical protein